MCCQPNNNLYFCWLHQSDDDISDTDKDLSIGELIRSFNEIMKIENQEFSECASPTIKKSSWYLLKLISRKLKNDPNFITEAAQLNLHISIVNFVMKLLPTAENNVSKKPITTLMSDYNLFVHHICYCFFLRLSGANCDREEGYLLLSSHFVQFSFWFLIWMRAIANLAPQ